MTTLSQPHLPFDDFETTAPTRAKASNGSAMALCNPNEPVKLVSEAFGKNISAGKNTYTYDAHTYHTKVPPQGIEALIEYYTNPGQVILDPFCGSGMTGVAALKCNRNVILSDLSPAAVFIAKNFNTPINAKRYMDAINTILKQSTSLENLLYSTKCENCGNDARVLYTVWSYGLICNHCQKEFNLWDVARDERESVKESKILKEFNCPNCGFEIKKRLLKRTKRYPVQVGHTCCSKGLKESKHEPTAKDLALIAEIDKKGIPSDLWYPRDEFPNGINTRQPIAAGITSIDKAYTTRSLYALAHLWKLCSEWPEEEIREKLIYTCTSLYQRVTVFSEFRFWGGSGNSANYNVPHIMNEQNVFRTFERKAKTIALFFREANEFSGGLFTGVKSATKLDHLDDKAIDYIFTDPPFGGNINYSEMNLLWESWLRQRTDPTFEAIVNGVQGKGHEEYEELLTKAFSECHRVLKDQGWMSVVFHNSSEQVWACLQRAILNAGFKISGTQTFDKRHGTFKMFVSDNAVGYDLVLHCVKSDHRNETQSKQESEITVADIPTFVKARLAKSNKYKTDYLHVKRKSEFDYRKLYSEWLADSIASSEITCGFEAFRAIVEDILKESRNEATKDKGSFQSS